MAEEVYPSQSIEMVERLKVRGSLKSTEVARVMKSIDRADFASLLPYEDW